MFFAGTTHVNMSSVIKTSEIEWQRPRGTQHRRWRSGSFASSQLVTFSGLQILTNTPSSSTAVCCDGKENIHKNITNGPWRLKQMLNVLATVCAEQTRVSWSRTKGSSNF
ncbi:hypothetical protein ElyMa_003527000 [Elysia marginata]|uniref:Uncharacterized protein n=1 Tax=Elysia marginata TaxID=1093978 RepID=A0AAV4EGZ3_9GAST|nr:hypothetical protein ElyMa_003527000 [Elysia marginata]